MSIDKQIVVRFSPEHWEQIDRFISFYFLTTKQSDLDRQAIEGVANHFHKASRLLRVAEDISQLIEEDEKELREKAYSCGRRSLEFTAVVESAITALYSSVDCARKTLRIVYPKAQGLPDSTRKLFQNASNDKIDKSIPASIRGALNEANWFVPLRVLRDALTHTNTGSCHRDQKTGKIRYFSAAVKPISGKGYVDDFLSYIFEVRDRINQFLGVIFSELNKSLDDSEVWQMCGTFSGRIYHRFVRPSEAIDFNSGRCGAFEWFENDENPTCPFAESCGAYKNRIVRYEA
jgi:hypothetical protein